MLSANWLQRGMGKLHTRLAFACKGMACHLLRERRSTTNIHCLHRDRLSLWTSTNASSCTTRFLNMAGSIQARLSRTLRKIARHGSIIMASRLKQFPTYSRPISSRFLNERMKLTARMGIHFFTTLAVFPAQETSKNKWRFSTPCAKRRAKLDMFCCMS
jgi:hypothetical protein